MELDDFKKAWQQETNRSTQNQNIMELIHHKSKGPIASLKVAFRKQMAAVTALMSIVIATNARHVDTLSSNLLFWTFIGFCVALIAGLYLNFRLTREMEAMDDKVKDNLEHHVALMEKRIQWQMIGARVVIIVLIFMLEIIPHFQHLRMLDTWHSLSPIIRFSAYAAYLVFQYFLSRSVASRKFGLHIERLKALLSELK